MPFNSQTFLETAQHHLQGAALQDLAQFCQEVAAATSPAGKARRLHDLMDMLEHHADPATCQGILESCGRNCITASTLTRARRLQQEATHLDDLLQRLNQAHIGGGHLEREGDRIHAVYERCYCGSVSQTRQQFSETYCHCSCGWYRQLFETLLLRPVQVDLLGSIIQGDECCRFLIRLEPGQNDRLPNAIMMV